MIFNECLKQLQKSKLQPKEVVIRHDREENEKWKLWFTFSSETWWRPPPKHMQPCDSKQWSKVYTVQGIANIIVKGKSPNPSF